MSAIIPIGKKYCIKLDTYSWAVCYWKTRKSSLSGGEWEGVSWHISLQQAGESLVRRLVSEDDLEGVGEIINALSASTRLVANAIIESGIPNSCADATYQQHG